MKTLKLHEIIELNEDITKDILIDKFKRAHKQEKTSPYMVSMFRELLSK